MFPNSVSYIETDTSLRYTIYICYVSIVLDIVIRDVRFNQFDVFLCCHVNHVQQQK